MDIHGIYLDQWSGHPRIIKDDKQRRLEPAIQNVVLKASRSVASWNKVFQENIKAKFEKF